MNEVFKFERNYKPLGGAQKSLSRKATRKASSLEGVRDRKRLVRDGDVGSSSNASAILATFPPSDGLTSHPTREESLEQVDQEMQDAGPSGDGSGDSGFPPSLDRMDTSESVASPASMSVQASTQHETTPPSSSRPNDEMLSPVEAVKDPPLVMRNHSGAARVNFHHVFAV